MLCACFITAWLTPAASFLAVVSLPETFPTHNSFPMLSFRHSALGTRCKAYTRAGSLTLVHLCTSFLCTRIGLLQLGWDCMITSGAKTAKPAYKLEHSEQRREVPLTFKIHSAAVQWKEWSIRVTIILCVCFGICLQRWCWSHSLINNKYHWLLFTGFFIWKITTFINLIQNVAYLMQSNVWICKCTLWFLIIVFLLLICALDTTFHFIFLFGQQIELEEKQLP